MSEDLKRFGSFAPHYKAFTFESVDALNEWMEENHNKWLPISIADTNRYITVLCRTR